MVEPEIYIRRAFQHDAEIIAGLSAVTFYDTFNGTCADADMHGFIQKYFNLELIEKELQNPDDFYFIVFFNTEPVGYMRLKEEQSDVEIINKHKAIELKRIYVLKEYHSKKVGASLMNFALNFAGEKNYEMIWLGVWEHNEKAKLFYKKYKFEDSGLEHPFPIGDTPQTDKWLYRFVRN